MVGSIQDGMEPRFDCQILVVGHLMAGKTTLIGRLLLKHFDMSKTKRTNGIIITHKGAMCNKDGKWNTTENPEDRVEILRRMKTANDKDETALAYLMTSQTALKAFKAFKEMSMVSNSQSGEGPTCRVHFMDFAGQSVFNSTHQMFMNHRAIYLLVLDISRKLSSEVEDDDVYCIGANRRMTVEGLTEFLMSSIHVYCGDHPDSYPKVFLVGTHKDLVEEITAKNRMERIVTKFKDTPLQKHVVGYFIVDCSIEHDPEIDKLRQSIFRIAAKEPDWGKETPTRWLPLEKALIKRRDNGRRVLTLQTVMKINRKCFARLQSENEIEDFLRFHNNLGNLMYFGGSAPEVLVILDPQWLVDALKQLITYEPFFPTTSDVEDYMEDFIQSAKLNKKLIEDVWSRNEDRTFITHMEQLLIIMEQTDVIATPLTYRDGETDSCSYYFVPSMLKPNPYGKAIVEKLLGVCRAKSPPLYFVFGDKFMQPAIFPRLQAECTSIYKLKEVQKQPLLFYQVAVLQLNQDHDLVIENVEHAVRVTVINGKGVGINPEICENVRLTIDDALKKIVRLYGNATVPFHMAIQSKETSADLDGLVPWSDMEMCERVHKETVLGPWLILKESNKQEQRLTKKGNTVGNKGLGCLEIGRLARRLDPADLLRAAKTSVTPAECKQAELDNRGNVVGEAYDTVIKWSKREDCLNLEAIHTVLEDTAIELLQEAVADIDLETYFKGFDQIFLEKIVSDESIDLIAQRSAKMYRFLALELGFDHYDIETVIQDVDGVTHRAKNLLGKWRQNNGSRATYREIGQAICEVEMDIHLLRDCERLLVEQIYPYASKR